jgi:glycerol-3-phosphate dehydrogenase (NAD(P)+)
MAAAVENEITFAWATKGLERGSGRFLLAIVHDHFGEGFPAAAISGPSFAIEVASGQPTALTVAAKDPRVATEVAELLHGGAMRAYTSDDLTGVQLGGAAKNVIAIAAGISDGLGFGANARAALITRGLAEMVRLGVLAGGRADTLTGLAGLGDLVLTSTDDKSRNRRFGLALGRGVGQQTAKKEIGQVVEGADAARELLRLGQSLGCELPITEQVNAVLFDGRTPRSAVEALLARERRAEHG